MEEKRRVVRAVSEDTERPYFRIQYNLSLSGRDLFGEALNLTSQADSFEQDNMEMESRFAEKRRSKSVHGLMVRNDRLNQEFVSSSTPRGKHAKFAHHLPSLPEDTKVDSNETMKRTRSVGNLDVEVNRYGCPKLEPENLHREDLGMGLITCLNSKNIKKYTVGQSYRRGVIVAIDEEQRKIVVYHANMPRGALILVTTENAHRYEKGYPVEDADGHVLGCVHAVDRVQNMLVVNTQATEETFVHASPFKNDTRRLSEVITRRSIPHR